MHEGVLQERRSGGLDRRIGCGRLILFLEEDCKDERTGVVVGAVAVFEPRHSEDRVLENSGGIRKPIEVAEADCRQFFEFRTGCGGRRAWAGDAILFEFRTRLLKNRIVGLRHARPDHVTPGEVGLLAQRMAARILVEQEVHCCGNRWRIAKRDKVPAAVREQFLRVPIRRRNHRLTRPETIGESAGSDLCLVQVGREVDVRSADEFTQLGIAHIAVDKAHI